MKTLLLLLCLLLSTYNSYAQSIEVIWEKKLAPEEKFLAVSRDNSLTLTYVKAIGNQGWLKIYDIKNNVGTDSVSVPEITTADFSPNGKSVICASKSTREWLHLQTSPLVILYRNYYPRHTALSDVVTNVLVKFSDTSNSKVWIVNGVKQGNPVGYESYGVIAYYSLYDKKYLFEKWNWVIPLSLSIMENDKGVISEQNNYYYSKPPMSTSTFVNDTNIYICKKVDTTFYINGIKSKGTFCHLLYGDEYLLFENRIVSLRNSHEFKLEEKLSKFCIVLGKSQYVMEYDEKNNAFSYRKITNWNTKQNLSHSGYKCISITPCRDSSHFISLSHDNFIRLSKIDFSNEPQDKRVLVNFMYPDRSIKPNEKIKFINTSFPLSSKHTFEWDFGDGTSSTDRDPTHQYSNSGAYSVRLIVRELQGMADTIIKKNAINVVFIDTNIVLSKKIWNKKLFSIEYSPNGEELVCRDTMNSFLLNKNNLIKLDSIINDVHGFHIIGNSNSQYYLTIHKGSKNIQNSSCSISGGSQIIFNIHIKRKPRMSPIDSFQIITNNCDLQFSKIYERMNTVIINDSVLGFSYSVKNSTYTGHPPSPYYFNQGIIKFFNLNNFNQQIPFKGEVFDGLSPGKTQFISPSYILSEKGITETMSKKLIQKYNFQNINDFAILDNNLFLAVTNDFVTPVILFNINGDTLHLFRSSLGVQTCIAVNPTNKNEFATADAEGRVTIWKVPQHSSIKIKPKFLDFSANIRDNTRDTISFTRYVFPPSNDLRVEWDFGDGEFSTENNPKHLYKNTGLYTVKLRYSVPQLIDTTIIKKNYIHIRRYPKSIGFSVSDTSVNKYYRIYFNNLTEQSQHFQYLWDFGDGTTSTEIHPEHFYNEYGTYSVSLTVIRPGMNDTTITKVNLITVKPIFKITWIQAPHSVKIGHPVTYEIDIEPKDVQSTVVWDFGNSDKGYTPKITYTFPVVNKTAENLGKKKILLTVRMDTIKYQESKTLFIGPDVQIHPKHSEINLKGKWTSFPTIVPQKGDYYFEWNWGDGTSTVQGLDAKHGYKKVGVYRIILRASERISGTFAEDTATVVVLPEAGKFSAYPNISQGEPITLHWYGSNGTISIQSLTGETVRLFQYSGETASHHLQWNLDDHYQNRLPPGLYYCTLKDSYGLPLSNPVFILY